MKYFSRHSFGKVIKINPQDVIVENIEGDQWSVSKSIFESEFDLNDEFSESNFVSRTELIEIVTKHPYTIMTVDFNKKVKDAEAKKKLHSLYPNKNGILSESDFKTKCNEILQEVLNGEPRTLIGYHTGKTDASGRIFFFDMETAKDGKAPEFRLVDPRTLHRVVIKDVLYSVKD